MSDKWWEHYAKEDALSFDIPNYKMDRFKDEIQSLEAQLKEARETIRHYGNTGNWRDSSRGFDSGEMDQIEDDSDIWLGMFYGGKRARAYLSKYPEEGET